MRQVDIERIEKIDIDIAILEDKYLEEIAVEENRRQRSFCNSKVTAYQIDVLHNRRDKIMNRYRKAYSNYVSFKNKLKYTEDLYSDARKTLEDLKREQKVTVGEQLQAAVLNSENTASSITKDIKSYNKMIEKQQRIVDKLNEEVIFWLERVVKHPGLPEISITNRKNQNKKKNEDIEASRQIITTEPRTNEEMIAEVVRRITPREIAEVIETDKFHCVTNEPSEELINMLRRPTIEIENDLDIDVKFED